MSSERTKKRVIVIGAGPAGLTAAEELLQTNQYQVTILERDSIPGGLAKTVDFHGYKFDFGPHHFITNDPSIEQRWKSLMGDDFISLRRYTRIYYNNHFFMYPLEPKNVLSGLSIVECMRCACSYVWAKLFPTRPVASFQDWVSNRFGKRLFSMFFKTYTEKVWGIPCSKISSDWAAHRIKNFSLGKAIFFAFCGRWFKKYAPRTIQDQFWYPTYGSGMLWDRVACNVSMFEDGHINYNETVSVLRHNGQNITQVFTHESLKATSQSDVYEGDYVLSSMPLKALISALDPLPPKIVRDAARALSYRGLITVNLVVNKPDLFPDHWLYIHEPLVRVGRIGNMNNFSRGMVANNQHSAISLEYFAFLDELFWQQDDQVLVALGSKELVKLGFANEQDIIDGFVQRSAEAYPVYDEHYKEHLDTVLGYLEQFTNLKLMGRNGLHRYNNMDQAMLSALAAVQTIMRDNELGHATVFAKQASSQKTSTM